MAWRIHDSIVRGEIDNRKKGRVQGTLWIDGLDEPIKLDLAGNACPDLAGCLLRFSNRGKTFPIRRRPTFNPIQCGRIGNLTASNKVRVFTVPDEEAFKMIDLGERPSERIANALYLEWFSEGNGRVVIESADFDLDISVPEWRLSASEEKQRVQDAEAGWAMFSRQLNDAITKHQTGQKDPETEWDEHDFEKLLRESDARTDKYQELLEKYGTSDEAEARIAQEMGWDRELSPEEVQKERAWIEEANAAAEAALNQPEPEPDPATEGKDWIRTPDGRLKHPLVHRCTESAMKFWHASDDLGLEKWDDDDLGQFLGEFQTTGAKLAGALNSIARDYGASDPAFTVACLKRSLSHLHQAQSGLEAVAPKNLLPPPLMAEARKELFEIREEILRLMDEYRGRE